MTLDKNYNLCYNFYINTAKRRNEKMGKTIRVYGSSHKRNALAKRPEHRSSKFSRDLEDIPNFKQMSAKIATETFDNVVKR